MLSFLKKFFGAKAAVQPCPEAPYKVEKPAAKTAAKPAKKAPAKKTTARKPKTNKS